MMRKHARAVALLAVCAATGAAAREEPCGCDPMPAPVRRAYRHEPEEQAIALLALESYFRAHPPRPGERVCVTLPGHRPAPRAVRDRLNKVGVAVEKRDDCRFEEGRTIWAAAGAWRTGSTEFVAHVIKSEFGDVSLFLEGYAYTLAPDGGTWRVVSEKPSPCNQSATPKRSGGDGGPCAAAEQ
jgi:hypothetical protein